MCLAIPGKLIEIIETPGVKMGKVDFGGVIRDVCLEAVPAAETGNYLIVHAGFALNILSEEEARDTLEVFRELDELNNQIEQQENT